MDDVLTPAEIERYSRHILVPEIGGMGQRRLKSSCIFVIGAGGLGIAALQYLVAAGVGVVHISDHDTVSISNLQRQVLYTPDDVGQSKTAIAHQRLGAQNPHVRIITHARFETEQTLCAAFRAANCALVLDCTDNFASRSMINRACAQSGIPLLSASVEQWHGQITLYDPAGGAPCFSCMFPHPPQHTASCATVGVLGALPGIFGTMIAAEAVKELLGVGESLRGTMVWMNILRGEYHRLGVYRDPECPVCSDK